MSENIEHKVAKAILQQAKNITVCGEVIEVAPASTATLILISEEVAKLPHLRLDSENILMESLNIAKDCRALGDIVAILILGAKNLKTTRIIERKRLWGLVTEHTEVVVDNKAELIKKLLENITPRELHMLAIGLLQSLQISDFFGLTTSLIEVNLLRATREVVTGTTVSGR